MTDFTHLHLHTEYSLLDGLNRSQKLLEKVKSSGMDSVAITDHGVMYGVPEFFFAAKDHGIKPIIGCEIYVSPGDHTIKKEIDGIKYYHLVLLAKNFKGYQNLNKIVSIGQLDGLYYKPRVDRETLKKHSEGIICTSACLAGPIARHINRNQEKKALDWLDFFKNTYKDDFYLELQRNGFTEDNYDNLKIDHLSEEWKNTIREQIIVNNKLKEYSDKYNIPMIATTDAHYLNEEDKKTQEILFAIKDGKLLSDPTRRIGYEGTYVKTPNEMSQHFGDIPEVLENTMKIAEKVEEYDITFERIQPKYYAQPKDKTTEEELRDQVYEGARKKYGEITPELDERLKYELEVIHMKGYDDYFLVVSDIMKWAQSKGIVVGVRGSVAGSVVAYTLDIIHVEPIKWELYFERFLNPERPSPPDIDMDIQDDRRDEIIRYVEEKYGKESVAAICAVGRMKTKAAIRDVARVMDIDLTTADNLSKRVHVVFGKVKGIAQMMEDDQEFAEIVNASPALIRLKENVEKIEGMARHISTHACGYLITPEPIVNFVSVQKESRGGDKVVTQNEGGWIEALGLMKFDFLGLRNLTIIKNTFDFVKKYRDIKLDIKKIPEDDKKTFELFSRGETIGVFQFEGGAMQKYLRQLLPETLEDICFMVSAYRPGPMQYIPDYIKRKHGLQETTYLIPEMEPILNRTLGFAIYQEQVIKIAVDIAGYSMGQADLLRRAMGKKKIKIMKEEEPKFKKGVMARGYSQEIADEIWNYLLPFADYGFNKAHGAGYAMVAYWCAYLKSHYPIEFMAGLMHSDLHDSDRVVIDMQEAQRMGIDILPPDINQSEKYFTIESKTTIRFGLGAIKNASEGSIEKIVEEREKNGEYSSLDNLIKRVKSENINKKTLEVLIKVGAMDKWGGRNQLLAVMPNIWDKISKDEKIKAHGQADIFGMINNGDNSEEKTPLPDVMQEESIQRISWEKDLIGTYVTEHPLNSYKKLYASSNFKNINHYKSLGEENDVEIFCIINSIKLITSKKSGKRMAFVLLEDFNDNIEGVIFPNTYTELQDKLVEFFPVVIHGKLNIRDDKPSIIINDIQDISTLDSNNKITIDIRNEKNRDNLENIKKVIKNNPGDMTLEIIYGTYFKSKTINQKVKPSEELLNTIMEYRV